MKKNVFLLLVIFIAAAAVFLNAVDSVYHNKFLKNAEEMISLSGVQDDAVINEKDLKGLPDNVARYLKYAGVVGKKKISYARLYHSGSFRPDGGAKWVPIKGEYVYTTKRPGFIWYGKLNMLHIFSVTATDTYFMGKGSMEIKALSFFTVGKATGKETDISSFGRFISEMPMLPTALMDKKTTMWQKIDFETSRAIVSDGDMGWSADFTFTPEGPIEKVEVKRFMNTKEGPKLEKFTGKFKDWQNYDGYMLPSSMEGAWDIEKGPYEYVKFKVDKIIFD
jgi:hypothetical protein